MRDVHALVEIGTLILDHVDEPLANLLQELEEHQRGKEIARMVDVSESGEQDREDGYDQDVSDDSEVVSLRFIGGLCKLSGEIRLSFQPTKI